jgi:hypothetical protein
MAAGIISRSFALNWRDVLDLVTHGIVFAGR